MILEIAGTGTSVSILQAAQRGRKHLSGIARHFDCIADSGAPVKC